MTEEKEKMMKKPCPDIAQAQCRLTGAKELCKHCFFPLVGMAHYCAAENRAMRER